MHTTLFISEYVCFCKYWNQIDYIERELLYPELLGINSIEI